MTNSLRIAVFPGDGIGTEITEPCVDLLTDAANRIGGFDLAFEYLRAGARAWRDLGAALPKPSMEAAQKSDAILLAAMGDPAIRYPDGTEITPQLDLRFDLGLYAGVRPVRSIQGVPGPLSDNRARALDFVLIRESTEGLFAAHGKGTVDGDSEARDTMVISRHGTERVCRFAFELASSRKRQGCPGKVSCIDKANIFRSMAFFRQVFEEVGASYDEIERECAYVDATALNFVRRPWDFDVLVTENMFGDILSDLGAGLIGGLGFAPSADIGDEHAVFQPCHGSAPDIAGQGKANPTAMFLSGAMMLEWLGHQHDDDRITRAGGLVRRAVDGAFASGDLTPFESGGSDGVREITQAVRAALKTTDTAEILSGDRL